jgi:hypothetical protein
MNKIDKSIYDNLTLLPEDTRGWNGNSDFFNQTIQKISPEIIIEVGTWKGQSAITMAKSVRENNLNSVIYCVDTWLGAIEFWTDLSYTEERNLILKNGYPQIYYQFLSNVVHNNLQDIILPFPNTSLIAARYFIKNNIKSKMIYIDGSHDEDDVYMDLKYYYNILENGGVMFGDDFSWYQVRNAVDKFTNEMGIKYETHPDNFWIINK